MPVHPNVRVPDGAREAREFTREAGVAAGESAAGRGVEAEVAARRVHEGVGGEGHVMRGGVHVVPGAGGVVVEGVAVDPGVVIGDVVCRLVDAVAAVVHEDAIVASRAGYCDIVTG